MKKFIILFLVSLGLLLTQCTEKYPKEVNRPKYEYAYDNALEVDKVMLTDSATIIYFDVILQPNSWYSINEGSYIMADGNKYIFQEAEGIEPGKENHASEKGEAHFKLKFPPLPIETKSIDFIEEGDGNTWKIINIDLTGKAKYTSNIPAELIDQKYADRKLPAPIIKPAKTKVTLQLSGAHLVKDDNIAFIFSNLFGERNEVKATKIGDNKYEFEGDMYLTSACNLIVNNKPYSIVLNPGEHAEIFLDIVAEHQNKSRYNPQKDIKYIAFKGDFEDINNSLPYFDNNDSIPVYLPFFFNYPDPSIIDMSKEEYINKVLEIRKSKRQEVEKSNLPLAAKEYLFSEIDNKGIFTIMLMNNLYKASYQSKNKVDYATVMKQEFPKAEAEDFVLITETDITNPAMLYTPHFSNLLKPSPELKLAMEKYGKQQLAADVSGCSDIFKKTEDIGYTLTAEDDKVLDNAKLLPNIKESAHAISINTKKAYEEVMKNANFIIEDTPKVSGDKIVEAIIAKNKGQALFIDVWATWCGPCLNAMKTMKAIKPQMKEMGIKSIYISGETSPKAKWVKMLPEIENTHYYLTQKEWDEMSKKYGIRGIPFYMIVNKAGEITYTGSGYPGNDKMMEELTKAVK